MLMGGYGGNYARAQLPDAGNHNPETIERFAIVDSGGLFIIGRTYKQLGVREGWLKLDGWHREGANDEIIVYRYRHIRRTVKG